MADKTIGDLNFAPGTVDDANTLFVVQQSGAAYKLSGHEFILAMESVLDGHGGIKTIVYTAPVAPSLTGTLTITLADNSVTTFSINNGKGITSIAKTGSAGTPVVDTYTITYNDNTTSTFTVTNGAKGDTGDSWYVWIRYSGSQPTQDSDMGTTPDNWMGIYSGTSSTAPTHYTSYQWFQIKGATGDTGAAATITATEVVYQTSASGTTIPTGTWSSTVPTVVQGEFLWTRTTVTFNSGSPVVWYAVAYQAVDGQGSPSTATPEMDSPNGGAGSSTYYSRGDHSHPSDTSKQDKITASGMLKGEGSGSVSAATKGTDYGALSFTVTLSSASWSSLAQTVSNANFVTSGYAYIVSPASASFVDYGTAQIYADNVTTSGQMTFHCVDTPSSNLTVNIARVVSA